MTRHELETTWSFDDMVDMNEMLDVYEAADRRAREEQETSR